MTEIFQQDGFVVNYYINGELFGRRELTKEQKKQMDILDFRKTHTLDQDIVIGKKTIPSGSTVKIEILPNIKHKKK